MRKFIFAERNGIYIIDLKKSLDRLRAAQQKVSEVILRGERVLFICTTRQLRMIVEQEAQRSDSLRETARWLGGMLTNFHQIKTTTRRQKDTERGIEEEA